MYLWLWSYYLFLCYCVNLLWSSYYSIRSRGGINGQLSDKTLLLMLSHLTILYQPGVKRVCLRDLILFKLF